MEKASSPIYKRICTAALCLLLIVYAVYHIALSFKEEIELFAVRGVTVTDKEIFTGYLFMESTAITSYGGGNCYYPYQDGEKSAQARSRLTFTAAALRRSPHRSKI